MSKINLPLRNNEAVIQIVKPHKIRHWFRYFLGAAIILLDLFFTFWLLGKGTEGKIFYFVVLSFGIYCFAHDFFEKTNYLVVTNERIFDVHKNGLFNQTISAMGFADLEDVVVEKRGIFSALFNFGLLTIYPKDAKFTFEIERIPKPESVQDFIFTRRDIHLKERSLENNNVVFSRLLKIIPELSEAELTLLYQKVHAQLLDIASATPEKPE